MYQENNAKELTAQVTCNCLGEHKECSISHPHTYDVGEFTILRTVTLLHVQCTRTFYMAESDL